MTQFLTPGLYRQTIEPVLRPGPLARGDIAVLIGYAARGPVQVPVRLQSLGQFEDVFGPSLAGGFLWHGVKGFFECGGRTAYVMRIADGTARAAQVDLGQGWVAQASFPWSIVDPRRANRLDRPDTAIWRARVEEEIRKSGLRRPDPGAWGNQLSLRLTRTSRVSTLSSPEMIDGGAALRLTSVAGVEPATIFDLSQSDGAGATIRQSLPITLFDPALRLVGFGAALTSLGFDPLRPIRIASVEFDLTILEEGKITQSFAFLSPSRLHSRFIGDVMASDCRALAVLPPVTADLALPAHWPSEGTFSLTRGTDGLDGVNAALWAAALPELQGLEDAALIAAPDLVRGADLVTPSHAGAGLEAPCSDISPRAPGYLTGLVVEVDQDGNDHPVPGVTVDVAGVGGSAVSDAAGAFAIEDIALGLADLRLTKPGFAPLETVAQASAFPAPPPVTFRMEKLHPLPALSRDAIRLLQQSMGNPAVVGRYKIALIDPVSATEDIDGLRSWVAEIGPEPRLGFFAPWIEVPFAGAEGGRVTIPPSAHIAGAFARAEQDIGIHRTGANLALRYVDGVSLPIDDDQQAGLNPVGVNAIRAFPGRGIRAFGTRSLALGTEWQYLTARRIVDAIEKTLERSLATLVFEPNSDFLRHAAKATTESFLGRIWRQGLLAGTTPEAGFRVKCDDENNPPESRDEGRLVLDVAVAPATPFEFILFRIGHAFDAMQVTETR